MNFKKAIGLAAVILALASSPTYADPGDGLPPGTPVSTSTQNVIFAAAHPDDETLAMGVAIAEHYGQNVHVLILTSGGASNAIHLVNDKLLSEQSTFGPLTQAQFMAAREAEAVRAVAALNPMAQVHFAHLADGALTATSAKAAILALADSLTSGPVKLKGHSYATAVEGHSDHLAVGQAIVALGTEQPTRFADRRHYVLPHSWGYAGSLPGKAWDYPASSQIAAKALAASAAYDLWEPPVSYAIGHLSVPGYFATLEANPRCLVHQ